MTKKESIKLVTDYLKSYNIEYLSGIDNGCVHVTFMLTMYCPELLDRLAFPIYGVLLGKETADRAIGYIKRDLLEE